MKKTLLLCVAIFISLGSFARISFGPEVGLNISKLRYSVTGSQSYLGINVPAFDITNSSRTGARFGGVANISIIRNLSVQPGIYYVMMGGGQKGETNVSLPASITQQFGFPIPLSAKLKTDVKTKLNYIQLPIHVNYHFRNLFVGIGPYFGYALNGTIKGTGAITLPVIGDYSTPVDSTLSFGSDKNSIKRFDYGASVNIGYDLPLGFFIRAYYQMGLAELSNDLSSSGKNTNFGISVGYLYNRKR